MNAALTVFPSTVPSDPQSSHDAILFLSFGGPNAPEDVVPFLENVTRGRGIPRERLEEVGKHYYQFGGKSPINELNYQLIADLRKACDAAGIALPIYFGNRNWAPYVIDATQALIDDGHRRILVVTTSAYSGYSSCCQYVADLRGVVDELGAPAEQLQFSRIRRYFNEQGFLQANVEAIRDSFQELMAAGVDAARIKLLFVTHSIPTTMNDTSGLEGDAYRLEHLDVSAEIARQLAPILESTPDYSLTYCSRSGPPSQPWLEPDVGDAIADLDREAFDAVVVAPIGFISDHMEVIYDLDTEAKEAAEEAGLAFARSATAGTHPAFIEALVRLVQDAMNVADAKSCIMVGGTRGACVKPRGLETCCKRDVPTSAPRRAATTSQ